MANFKNKFKIESARAQWWDYGWNGAYFLTICTKNRKHFFGKIENQKMILSHTGVIADIFWYEIPYHHNNVELDEFVVMPNHIHGIIIIDKPIIPPLVETGHALSNNKTGNPVIDKTETGHALSLQSNESNIPILPGQNRFQNIGSNTISSIAGSYKSAVTKHANRLGFENGWQTRFYDHIIRNYDDYLRISNYIRNNPINWKEDKFFN